MISVHALTNNVSKKTPQEVGKGMVEALDRKQKNNPRIKIAFSAGFRRSDSHELNAKTTQLNYFLAEKLQRLWYRNIC